MNTTFRLTAHLLLCAVLATSETALAQEKEIPELLKVWEGWALWGDKHQSCPTPYNSGQEHICFWPSQLSLSADPHGGAWNIEVRVFDETWVPLPGSDEVWPMNVRANGDLVPVVARDKSPAVRLPAGIHRIVGDFQWDEMPQRIAIPRQVGIVSLTVDGQPVSIANWDAEGNVWLRRLRAEPADEDRLSMQVYRLVEDGIPIWLRTQVHLTVSGKSREEQLGSILPQGWRLSLVESQIPVAVDDEGRMKAQVRAGEWTIGIHAFRTSDAGEIRFAPGAEPAAGTELVGFRANPEFRIGELEDMPAVDVAQTTFPKQWRGLPVYAWNTDTPFRLVEKMRGMGLQRPEGLSIDRWLWLDENGEGFTYRDRLQGQMQQIWRLDVAKGRELGAVRVDGEGQLITANPKSGAHGVEIRSRNLNLEAIGRMPRTSDLLATGWQTDADSLEMTMSLPPGWRLFALFGADRVDNDWLTAWSLLDLFLLLIFSLAVGRLWGLWAGIVALLAFGLAYHEPYAPRFTWLFLLIPLALLRVAPEGAARRWLTLWKYVAAALLILCLVPFFARQLQGIMYPQLETRRTAPGALPIFGSWAAVGEQQMREAAYDLKSEVPARARREIRRMSSSRPEQAGALSDSSSVREKTEKAANLQFDPGARIQTGPAEPEWSWNEVHCSWSGPVSAEQRVRPVLISLPVNRLLTVLRLTFLMVLVAVLFNVRFRCRPISKQTLTAATVLAVLLVPSRSLAQVPGQQMLDVLRQRLLEPSDAYPNAAEIPQASIKVSENKISMDVEIHAAIDVAVPLPGRLPTWSPLSVKIDDLQDATVCRRLDYLWVGIPAGVHHVAVEGLLPDTSEWEWTFFLRPRRVSVDAPGWNVTGVGNSGVPDPQVFFSRQQETTPGEAAYDQRNFQAIVEIQRRLEVGLVWKVHNLVTRLSSPGKAVSLEVPLLDGESVLTSDATIEDGKIAVRLAAGQTSFAWDSELPMGGPIHLQAATTDEWVEHWRLVSSPVWNVALTGLAPVFEPDAQNLIPAWHPWPGEEVTLAFSKPEAISGDTVTVRGALHDVSLGSRQRTANLKLDLECSLAGDFVTQLDPKAEITALKLDDRTLPVRRDGAGLVVPVHAGRQSVEIAWRTPEPMATVAASGAVKLPVEGSNVTAVMHVPESRWVLWAHGPLMGPAVRFWTILACAVLAALVLGSLPLSPLRRTEWVLLALGLTQVHVVAAMWIVGWLFLLAWRGRQQPDQIRAWRFDLLQVGLVLITLVALGILIVVVSEGLLGSPEMFIRGNGSSQTYLQWYQGRVGPELPEPYVLSISVWFYRLLMLAWALWLAAALLRWLRWGWNQFSHGGGWKRVFRRRTLA
jgi:hypothetical protein